MNRRLFLSSVAAATVAAAARPAHALFGVGDIVFDPTSYGGQLISIAKQAQQYLTQLAQLQTELNSYTQLIRSGIALPSMVWGMAQGDIAMVRGIANGASMLAGGAGGIMNRLSTLDSYANSLSMTPAMLSAQFQSYQSVFANADQTLGRVLQTTNTDGLRIAATQDAVKAQAAAAAGQLQAIQAGVSATTLISDQMQTMQTTMASLATEIGTKDLIDSERTAQSDAAWQQYLGTDTTFQTTGHVSGP